MTSPTQITEQVTTGNIPGMTTNTTGGLSQRRTSTLRADPRQEYVAAGTGQLWYTNYLHTLPWAYDDLLADFGDDLYDRMLLDSQVAACVHFFKMAVLSDPVQVSPAVDAFRRDDRTGEREPHPDFEPAKELSDFVAHCFDSLPDLHSVLYDLLDGAPFGNRVAEIILEPDTDSDKVVLKALKPKPRRSLAFVVDVFSNLIGLLALIPGQFSPILLQSMIFGDASAVPNLLPRSKFAVLTFRPRSCDPRGNSLLRPAYDAWWVKQQVKQERLKYLARLAGGSVVGFTAENAQQTQKTDPVTGELAYDDATGDPLFVNPEQAMLEALIQWENGTCAAFPFGSKVEVNYPHPDSPFDAALDRQDREIATAILGSTRMVMEAEHGSRADSETGQDVFGLLVRHGKQAVESMLKNDVVRLLVEMNYPKDVWHLCPNVSLSKTEHQDFAQNLTAVSAAYSSGYLAQSQFKDTDAMVGLPIRTEETDGRVEAQKMALQAKQQAPPQNGDAQNKPNAKFSSDEDDALTKRLRAAIVEKWKL